MSGVVPVSGGIAQDPIDSVGHSKLELKGVEGVSSVLGIDQSLFRAVGGIYGW